MLQTVLHEDIPVAIMERLSTRVADVLGLYYPPQRWSDLLRSIRAALHDSDEERTRLYIEKLADLPWQAHDIEILTPFLTVGETYFWREPQTLVALQTQVLPPLIEARRAAGSRRLRLWSAGCCTGEEPYSLAILLHRMLPDITDWDIRVLGTDLNPDFLRKAARGKYRPWSFRGTPQWIKERYFHFHDGETYEVSPEIKQLVTFAPLNLAADNYPSSVNATEGMDIIFCRNVLIYMDATHTNAILNGFVRCLKQGGWLALSATETWLAQSTKLVPMSFKGAMLFHHVAESPRPTRPAPRSEYSIAPRTKPTPRTAPKSLPQKPLDGITQVSALTQVGTPKSVPSNSLHTAGMTTQSCLQAARDEANRGQMQAALGWCEQALRIDRLSASAYYLRASILQENSSNIEAAQALSQALFLDADFIMAHFAAGNLALRCGRTQQAKRHWNNALQLLNRLAPEALVPESEDMTAGHLQEMISAALEALQ